MTTQLTYIGDIRALAVLDLLHFDRLAPRMKAFVEALSGASQDIEDAAFDLLLSTGIEDATGRLLERLGRIVGERRGGLDDNAYRGFVRVRIQANLSAGARDELIAIFRDATGAERVRHFDLFPAAYAIYAERQEPMTERHRERVGELMRDIKPGGIGMTLIETDASTFTFDTGPGFDTGALARLI
ncbi:MAG: hypothetical protein ACNA8W_02375 [Bradymonadaceae bacterium]